MKTLVSFSTHRCLPCYTLRKWKNTTLFQGHRKRNTYFEGWYYFATYRSTKLNVTCDDSNGVTVKLENKTLTFVVSVQSAHAGLLKAPTEGTMDRRIPESIDAVMDISVYDKAGRLVLTDRSTITGLEMVGDYNNLHRQLK